MAAIGPQELEALIGQLMSPDNAARGAAEATYAQWKNTPDVLLAAVMQVLLHSNIEAARNMCIILLRSLLTKASENIWGAIAQSTRQSVCENLLAGVVNESNPVLRNKFNTLVADVGAKLLAEGQWPELVPFLQASFDSPTDSRKESALTIFGELASSLGQYFEPYYVPLKNNLHAGLCNPNLNVRIAAMVASCNFLQGFFRPEQRSVFLPLGPLIVETTKAVLTANREEEAQSALKLLVQLAESEPLFLQQCVQDVVSSMLAVANATNFESDTRRLACEVLLTLAETRPAWIRKMPACSSTLIQLSFNLMLSMEDMPLNEWNQLEDDDNTDMENYDYGEEYLNRLSLALGGRTIVPQFFPLVNKLLENKEDWRHRYCAAMGISIIGEGSVKTLLPHLSDILNNIVPLLNDPHPKVRWAGCNCIGQMSTDFGPKLQKKFHSMVLPALVAVMDDVNNPRTRGHAAAALVNFVERCDIKIFAEYLQPVLEKLYSLLQTGNLIVQQQAILAIAAVADVSEDRFINYHDIFMPPLLHIVTNCKAKEQRKLRGQAIECISIIGVAVGKEKFKGAEVMGILMREQALAVDIDDPQRPYIDEAMVRLCRCLKKDFAPFIATVLPPILNVAEKSDITVSDSNPEGQPTKDGWEYVVLGDKCVGVRTASLDEKAAACDMLVSYAEELGGDFFNYIDPVLKIMVPLLKFYYTEDVREAAADCMPALLNSAKEYTSASGAAAGADLMYVRNLFAYMFPTFIEAIENEMEIQVLNVMLTAFVKCLDILGDNAFNAEQLERMTKAVINLIKDYLEFMDAQRNKEEADEEEEESAQDEISIYEDVIANIADMVGRLLKHHGTAYLPIFQPILPHVLEFLKPTSRIAERHIALCVVDDLVDNGGKETSSLFPHIMPLYLEYLVDADPAIRQAAAFGVGIFARVGTDAFFPFVADTLARLNAACSKEDANSEEFEMATDNAVSSIAWICATFPTQLDLSTILPLWLRFLPIRADEEEAVVVYNNLCNFVEQPSTTFSILGKNYEHLSAVVLVFGRILGTDFVDQALTSRIQAILKGVMSLPSEALQKAWAVLPADVQQNLQKYL